MPNERRVAVIGIDCLTPKLLFEQYAVALPHFCRLREQGRWGTLKSTVPPITVPAWMCMATSQDPGQLGIYGFRNRADRSYEGLKVADASWVRAASLWQLLTRRRRPSVVVGVPLTYPPRPIEGVQVSGIPVPQDAEVFTAPASLRSTLDEVAGPGGYPVDARNFRDTPPEALLAELNRLRETRFDVVERLSTEHRWDLLFMVEMGVDRLHHAFWRHTQEDHPRFVPDSPFASALRDYHVALDARVGRLVASFDERTAVLVVSDHGARAMHGGVRVNEWLIREGLLALLRRPATVSRLMASDIDWTRTQAWADGGYYARVFLNVEGREPRGTLRAADYPRALAELKARLEAMLGPDGRPLSNRVFVPGETYRESRGVPPDLIVYLGDLAYRSNATVLPEPGPAGPEDLFALENDTGVDGANHAEEGVVLYRPARTDPPGRGERIDASIYDVAPTVLTLLGEPVPPQMIGRSWVEG